MSGSDLFGVSTSTLSRNAYMRVSTFHCSPQTHILLRADPGLGLSSILLRSLFRVLYRQWRPWSWQPCGQDVTYMLASCKYVLLDHERNRDICFSWIVTIASSIFTWQHEETIYLSILRRFLCRVQSSKKFWLLTCQVLIYFAFLLARPFAKHASGLVLSR